MTSQKYTIALVEIGGVLGLAGDTGRKSLQIEFTWTAAKVFRPW